MQKFREPFLYTLTIENRTRLDLVVLSRRIDTGVWFRDEESGLAPRDVPAGATVQALGVKASATNNKGYGFRCSWGVPGNGDEPESAVTVSVNVPLVGAKNKAGLDVSGYLKVEGWTGVLPIGHEFHHTLVVRQVV